MMLRILDTPLLRHAKPWWQPFLSLSLTLYGILALNWNLQPIVCLFWLEIIMMSAAALIRALFALNGGGFFDDFLKKIFLILAGSVMFCGMIMLAVTFSFKVFEGGMRSDGFHEVPTQMRILLVGYVLGLIIHYFANGRYKNAEPIKELMQTFVHIFLLLAILMVLCMHLIPAYPNLDQALWVGVAVVVVKFFVDLIMTNGKRLIK